MRHIATVVRDEVGYDMIRSSVTHPLKGLKVAIHYGCHLLKPTRIMKVDNPDDPSVLENLIRALGATRSATATGICAAARPARTRTSRTT